MKIRKILLILILFFIFLISGCAYRSAVLKGYDFTKIKKVGILSFSPANIIDFQSAGDAISDQFVMQLLSRGIVVVERQRLNEILQEKQLGDTEHKEALRNLNEKLGVDVLITGTILKFIPDKKNYVVLGDVKNPEGEVKTKVVLTNAEVGISARMIDLKTGNIVWVGSYSYESYNLDDAIFGVVSYLVSSLKSYWPQLNN